MGDPHLHLQRLLTRSRAQYQNDLGQPMPQTAAALGLGGWPERVEAVAGALLSERVLLPVVLHPELSELDLRWEEPEPGEIGLLCWQIKPGVVVVPAFSSVAAMHQVFAQARPVPVSAKYVALAALRLAAGNILLDAGAGQGFSCATQAKGGGKEAVGGAVDGATGQVGATIGTGAALLTRMVTQNLAVHQAWLPPWKDTELHAHISRYAADLPGLVSLSLRPGQVGAGAQVHLVVDILLQPDTPRPVLARALTELSEQLRTDQLISARADHLELAPALAE